MIAAKPAGPRAGGPARESDGPRVRLIRLGVLTLAGPVAASHVCLFDSEDTDIIRVTILIIIIIIIIIRVIIINAFTEL
jgi:hypothetical protein